MRALIISGTGRYSDPWHPLPTTSRRVGDILQRTGFDVTIDDVPDRALASCADFDLVVVNATDPWRNGETGYGAVPAAAAGLAAAVECGTGFLALHNSIASLRDYGLWRRLVGGSWVPGVSMHPDIDEARIELLQPAHSLMSALPGAGDDAFTVFDERYCELDVDDDVDILARHQHLGRWYPTFWTHVLGRSRVVYDALGHDARSFDAPAHVDFVRRAAAWVVQRGAAPVD